MTVVIMGRLPTLRRHDHLRTSHPQLIRSSVNFESAIDSSFPDSRLEKLSTSTDDQ